MYVLLWVDVGECLRECNIQILHSMQTNQGSKEWLNKIDSFIEINFPPLKCKTKPQTLHTNNYKQKENRISSSRRRTENEYFPPPTRCQFSGCCCSYYPQSVAPRVLSLLLTQPTNDMASTYNILLRRWRCYRNNNSSSNKDEEREGREAVENSNDKRP